jgi:hypothetical protein
MAEPRTIGTLSPSNRQIHRQQLAQLELDQVEQLRVVRHVAFVEKTTRRGMPT